MTKKQISFLIVNYNSKNVLERCLSDIKKTSKKYSYEIIVANNDKEKLILADESVKVINNKNNLGFGRANNLLAKIAIGEVFVFVNPDTHSFSDNFCDIINLLTDNVGIVAPNILNNDGKIEKWSYGKTVSLLTIIKNNIFGFRDFCYLREKCSVGWVSGAVFCIKAKLFNKIGGFDEEFFLYYEDVDLCRRVKKAGFKIIKTAKFKVRHVGGSSMNKKSLQKKYYYNSQCLYIKKNYGKMSVIVLKIIRKLTHNA